MRFHGTLTQRLARLGAGLLLSCLVLLSGPAATATLSPEDFRDPPLAARPWVLWSWLNGHFDHAQITRELTEMKAHGIGGAVIWDVGSLINPGNMIPAGPEFLGPESLKAIHHAMDEAERLGLELGLFASSSWNAGGTWITPKDGSKALLIRETVVEGPAEFSGVLPLPEKTTAHHEDVAVLAVPDAGGKSLASTDAAIDLTARTDAGGRLEWKFPAGKWRVLRFVRNNTGEFLNCPSPNSKGLVIDHLSREATDAYMVHMLDRLKEGRDGYGPMKVLMLDSYEVRPGIDWTPDFTAEFRKRNGYDPTPWLPVLAGWTVGDKELSARFHHDYRKLVSDLMVDHHFARCRELLNERGLQLLAEGGHGGHPRVDPLKALGAADIPMGEFWNHRKNWVTKEAASAANIYGHKIVASESFTGWQNWQDGPAAYKRLFDIALCAGLNRVYFHTFSHNPPDAGLPGYAYHAGEHFNATNTWWKQSGPMLADMGRACHLLQQGRFVADVCAYYGDEAPNLVPARRIAPTIEAQWPDDRCAHCGQPKPVDLDSLGGGYDYDYINEEVILTRMQVRDGLLVLPDGMSYRMMVLPDRKTISPAVLRRLGELVEAGATIVGPRPERSNSLRGYPQCDREVEALAARIWGDCDGKTVKSRRHGKGRIFWNMPLAEILAGMGVDRDFVAEGIDNSGRKIDYIHRTTEREDIYFVSNSSLERQVVRCRFRDGGGRVPSFWDSSDGSVRPCLAWESKDGFTWITLDLAPASSIFVVFSEGPATDSVAAIEGEGAEDLELVALEDGTLTARTPRKGTWKVTTTQGRKGTLAVDTEPREIPVEGPWDLGFPKDRGAPESVTLEALTDWTEHQDPGVRHFSGTAVYRKVIDLPALPESADDPVILDLGMVAEVATVTVNGREAGIVWKAPWRIDIREFVKPGANELAIAVTNLWNNRIVGDLRTGEEFTRTNIKGKFNRGTPLLRSGLLGPVVVRMPATVRVTLAD